MKLLSLWLILVSVVWAGQPKQVGKREISVIVTKEGYYPKSLSVFQGEKVKFYVTSTVEEPDCFLVQGHKIFLAATKGKISETEVTFDTPGNFSFYCPSSRHDGQLTVLPRTQEKLQRKVAGENDPAQWIPKDYE